MILVPNTDNEISAATLTVSSEDANYPKANIKALPVAQTFRTTGDTAESVLMDFGAPVAINFFALINHNLTSAATITLKAGTTSGVTNFTQVITWAAETTFKKLAGTETYRYWKLELADAANPDAYIEIGYLVLAVCTAFTFGPLYGTLQIDEEDVNNETLTEFGAQDARHIYSKAEIRFDLRRVTSDDDTIRALLRTMKGSATPALLVIEDDVLVAYFGRFYKSQLRKIFRTEGFTGFIDRSMIFRADGFGRTIDA
jgi:hypothetical protein